MATKLFFLFICEAKVLRKDSTVPSLSQGEFPPPLLIFEAVCLIPPLSERRCVCTVGVLVQSAGRDFLDTITDCSAASQQQPSADTDNDLLSIIAAAAGDGDGGGRCSPPHSTTRRHRHHHEPAARLLHRAAVSPPCDSWLGPATHERLWHSTQDSDLQQPQQQQGRRLWDTTDHHTDQQQQQQGRCLWDKTDHHTDQQQQQQGRRLWDKTDQQAAAVVGRRSPVWQIDLSASSSDDEFVLRPVDISGSPGYSVQPRTFTR